MITRDDEMNIDFGLNVLFDEKNYRLMMDKHTDIYPVGGLICEYLRLDPKDIKDVILSCEDIGGKTSSDDAFDILYKIHNKFYEVFPPVTATMIALEFFNAECDWYKAVRENRIDEFLNNLNDPSWKGVKDYIFENSGYSDIGGETIGQLLLTSYFQFCIAYITTKHIFKQTAGSEDISKGDNKNSLEVLSSLYGTFMDMQHIDYRIILLEEKFQSLYTIKSSPSLLIFEIAHCLNAEINFVKCKNCGNYFVPEGRSDSVYCSYPLRDNDGKTCKDVGAQITRANKEKNDESTREYRKVYMRYKMMTNRHPEDIKASKKFNELTTDAKSWRKKLANGSASTEEFLNWLKKF